MPRRKTEYPHWLSFRLDDSLYEKIINGSRAANMSHGEYIRRQLTKGKVVVKQEIIAEIPQLKKLIAEFGKIGSNLNQIAHHYNAGGSRSREMYERTQRAISELYAMKFEVQKMGGDFAGYSQARLRKKQ